MWNLDEIVSRAKFLLGQVEVQFDRYQTRETQLREMDRLNAKRLGQEPPPSVDEIMYRREQRGSVYVQLMEIRGEVDELFGRVDHFLRSVEFQLAPDGEGLYENFRATLEEPSPEAEHLPMVAFPVLIAMRSALVRVSELCCQMSTKRSEGIGSPIPGEGTFGEKTAEGIPAPIQKGDSIPNPDTRPELARRLQAAIDRNRHNMKAAAGHIGIHVRTLGNLLDGLTVKRKTSRAAEQYISGQETIPAEANKGKSQKA